VTPNAIDNTFAEVTVADTSPTKKLGKFILYVSRIEPRKNHILLLKGFLDLELYKKGYTLVFIGARDIKDKKLEQFVSENQLLINNHVVWKDNVPFEEVKAYYKEAALFVFPSLAEGFGIPVLEALAFNTKVLVSNATAMSDFTLPEELSFNPHNYSEFKTKLAKVLESEKNYEAAYKKIISVYDWAKSATILKKLLVQHNAR